MVSTGITGTILSTLLYSFVMVMYAASAGSAGAKSASTTNVHCCPAARLICFPATSASAPDLALLILITAQPLTESMLTGCRAFSATALSLRFARVTATTPASPATLLPTTLSCAMPAGD